MKKYLFVILGSLSLFLGFLGLFTPGIPTTPFVLLTGYLYARSSPRLYAKLQQNRIAGACLRSVEEGLDWKYRLISILFMWVMILLTAFLIFDKESTMRYVMLGLGVIGTISQMIALRKRKPKVQQESRTEIVSTSDTISKTEVTEVFLDKNTTNI